MRAWVYKNVCMFCEQNSFSRSLFLWLNAAYTAIMLQRDYKSQRLYLHDVIAANKKEIESKDAEHLNTTGATSE